MVQISSGTTAVADTECEASEDNRVRGYLSAAETKLSILSDNEIRPVFIT